MEEGIGMFEGGFLIDRWLQRIKQGVFIDGELIWGHVTYVHINGNQVLYVGKLESGKKQGVGVLYFSDWERYRGSFKEGRYDGHGEYNSANGDK